MSDKRNSKACVICKISHLVFTLAILVFSYFTSWWMLLLLLVFSCDKSCGLDE